MSKYIFYQGCYMPKPVYIEVRTKDCMRYIEDAKRAIKHHQEQITEEKNFIRRIKLELACL